MPKRQPETALQELLDKQQLYENMMLYARGQDRRDLALVKSTYWPDATEHHGMFVGSAHDFCDWTHERQKITRHHALHHLGNTLSELLGSRAKRETAFLYVQVDADRTKVLSGRYRDLCEKRDEEWKVLRRLVICDWAQQLPPNADYRELFDHLPTARYGTTHPDDAIYQDWEVLW
jgi:hypothetical protein